MRTIHKFPIPNASKVTIMMPKFVDIIKVDMQQNVGPCIWAIIDTEDALTERTFRIIGTGWDLADLGVHNRYLGTWQNNNGFVWHLFGER